MRKSVSDGASERGLLCIMNTLAELDFLERSGNKHTLTLESEAFLVNTSAIPF
jgi:hypothetical protein